MVREKTKPRKSVEVISARGHYIGEVIGDRKNTMDNIGSDVSRLAKPVMVIRVTQVISGNLVVGRYVDEEFGHKGVRFIS